MYFKSLNFENDVLNEGLFSKHTVDMKQNCIPLDLSKAPTQNIGRIICLNTHFNTVLAQAIQSKGIIGKFLGAGAILSVLGGVALGGIGALAGLPIFLYTSYNVGGALLRQHDARDFMIIPTNLNNEDPEYAAKINEDYFLKFPIIATNDGEVIHIYNEIRNGQEFNASKQPAEGNHVIISHYNGKFYSLYGHLYQNSITVNIGDKVKKGQVIGLAGNTGNSSSPHLHFDMAYIDPRKAYSLGKALKNFEPYYYTPFDLKNQDEKYWINIMTSKLIKNSTGTLHDSCFVS